MIDYRVRSVSLLNLVNDVKAMRLRPDAYFQRNLVWREVHKKDFIKTILLGLPFPQIFISKGKVDVENMQAVSCIVDGQQRTAAILSFINNEFEVDGSSYASLMENQKSEFLKYEIAVIELDLENDDPKVKEIFQRINRTSNSLSTIEKLASEYATSEFMLVAKLLADQIDLTASSVDDLVEDPNIPPEFYDWAKKQPVKNYRKLINEKGVFNAHEIARKANLMFTLNTMAVVTGGYANRNEKAMAFLEDYAQDFPEKAKLVRRIDRAAAAVIKMGFARRSYWLNKANIYTLLHVLAERNITEKHLALDEFKRILLAFEEDVPGEYRLAASEAVNSVRARVTRFNAITGMLDEAIEVSEIL